MQNQSKSSSKIVQIAIQTEIFQLVQFGVQTQEINQKALISQILKKKSKKKSEIINKSQKKPSSFETSQESIKQQFQQEQMKLKKNKIKNQQSYDQYQDQNYKDKNKSKLKKIQKEKTKKKIRRNKPKKKQNNKKTHSKSEKQDLQKDQENLQQDQNIPEGQSYNSQDNDRDLQQLIRQNSHHKSYSIASISYRHFVQFFTKYYRTIPQPQKNNQYYMRFKPIYDKYCFIVRQDNDKKFPSEYAVPLPELDQKSFKKYLKRYHKSIGLKYRQAFNSIGNLVVVNVDRRHLPGGQR